MCVCMMLTEGPCAWIECSAKKNRGVNEAFSEAARVAMSVKGKGTGSSSGGGGKSCSIM